MTTDPRSAAEYDPRLLRIVALYSHKIHRSVIVQLAAQLEAAVDEVLAEAMASSLSRALILRNEVLWRLPIAVRLDLLKQVLQERGLEDWFPFLIPVLKRLYEARHLMAHGIDTTERPSRPARKRLAVAIVKRGRPQIVSHDVSSINWLIQTGHQAVIHLARVWAYIASDAKAWHET